MRLVKSAPDWIELRGRDAVRSPVWVGLGLLLGPSLLSLFGPAPFTPFHVFGLVVLLALSVGLIALGWPRLRWVRIRPAGRTLVTSEEGERVLGDELTVRLIAVPTEGSSGNALYGVGLEEAPDPANASSATAPTLLLLARDDPADTLADLAALRARLPLRLRVVGGWGLVTAAPWTDLPPPARGGRVRASALLAPWDDRAARRPVIVALVVGAVSIGIAMAMEIKGRLDLGDPVAPLSIALPLLGLTLLAVVIAALITHRVRIRVGPELSCERRIFGVTYRERRLPRTEIRGAYPVSPSGHGARHFLFDTDTGPVAFPCDDALATQLAAEFAPRGTPTAAGR